MSRTPAGVDSENQTLDTLAPSDNMLFSQKTLLGLLASTAAVIAAPTSLEKRAVINHDAVVGFPQTVPSGLTGQLYLKYKPYLKVDNGCVPFPAVDSSGNTGYVFVYHIAAIQAALRGGHQTYLGCRC